VVYVNSPKKEHSEYKKEVPKGESYVCTILAFSYSSNYTSSSVLQMNLIFVEKNIFKEEYCTISVLYGTAGSKKLDSTGK